MSVWDTLTSGLDDVSVGAGDFVNAVGSTTSFVFDLGTDVMDSIFDEVSSAFDAGGIAEAGAGASAVDAIGKLPGAEVVDAAGNTVQETAQNMVQGAAETGGQQNFMDDLFKWAKSPEGRAALASGAVALYKQRRQDQLLKDEHKQRMERDRVNKLFVGSYYGG